MPKQSTVDLHPDKAKIIKMLTQGKTCKEISEKYVISKQALHRYLHDRLSPRATQEIAKRDAADGNSVLAELDFIMSRMKKLYNACDDYLTDPDNKERYTLLPRAWEAEICYLDYSSDPPQQKKMSIQAMIDEMRGKGKELVEIKYKHHDPRKMITETANTMTKQLELLARIQGSIKDVSISIVNNPAWIQVQAAILQATDNVPEIREKLAKELSKIEDKN